MPLKNTENGAALSTKTVPLPQFGDSERGMLGVATSGVEIPFSVTRAFYLYNMPLDAVRGEHAHCDTHQFIICLAGAIDATLWDINGERSTTLASPAMGLYVPPMTWLGLVNRATGTVCLVLASKPYDDADYIRDRDEFSQLIAADIDG